MFSTPRSKSPNKKTARRGSIGSKVSPHNSDFGRDGLDGGEPNTLPKLVIDVQNEISSGWDFMTSPDFNPVPHALSLLDESSLGRDYRAFCEAYGKLEGAMDLIVNDYHQAFNTSIQTFSNVVENITDSQRRVRETRANLENSKDWLQCKRFDLLHLWLKSIQYKEINRILDQIEELQGVPDRLESLIQAKYFLTAVKLLVSATRNVEEGECSEIGALEAVKQKLQEMHGSLHETLIEELHSHLYLKSPFTLYRVEAVDHHTLRKQHSGKYSNPRLFRSGPDNILSMDRSRRPGAGRPGSEPLEERLQKIAGSEDPEETAEDLETNPEADSYQYIQSLLESLAHLGRLGQAMEVIRERLPVELYYVVERTVQEVDHRFGKLSASATDAASQRVGNGGPNLLGTDVRNVEVRLLLEFLWELFLKLEAIVQGHRFLQAVALRISKKSGLQTEGWYTIRDVWFTAQNELKALLYEYVRNPERKITEASVVVSLNDLLKDRRRARTRPPDQPLYRVIVANDDEMRAAYLALNPEAGEMAANVVTKVRQVLEGPEAEADEEEAVVGVVDSFASNTVVAGHRLLITPDPYNILVVFGPTSAFVLRMETMLSARFGNLRSFLDEFIISVFLPQMENRVLTYFHNYANGSEGLDAFHTDFYVDLSPFPLSKSATALAVLVQGICRTIPIIPIHQEEAIAMIENVLRSYYDKCQSRFNALISSSQPGADGGYSSIVSASWVREGGLLELLTQYPLFRYEIGQDKDHSYQLTQKETYLEMTLKKDRSFHRSELIMELRNLQAIASLHHSVEWFIGKMSRLFVAKNTKLQIAPLFVHLKNNKGSSSESLDSYFKLSSESLPELPVEPQEDLQLGLQPDLIQKFQAVLTDYQKLSDTCLHVLRVELRCHSMYYLDLAMREGTYFLDDDSQEPDPYIGLLNLDLSTIEEALSAVLHPQRTRFVFDGLAFLIARTLCSNLKHIRRVNSHGVSKLVRNVQSLQQNLTNISSVPHKNLGRAKQYFQLLNLTGESLLQFVKEQNNGKFSFDDVKVILDIISSDSIGSEQMQPGHTYSEILQALKNWFVSQR
ncbi:Sec8 exocyst complex component-specific domain-containing protein [Phlyctochytrium arcticum]|nr:Sec8 exocyst complex component-specific domain-containing protein [Phlyctochytrium arcticum]